MLDRTTDLTSDRLFHSRDRFHRYSKIVTKIKAEIFGVYDYIQLDSARNTSSDKILNFKLKMAKLGIFFSNRDEEIFKYHFFNDNKYCDRCGREFSILGLVDNKHYCIQVPNKEYNLCKDCDDRLKRERGYGGVINELLFGEDNNKNFRLKKYIF